MVAYSGDSGRKRPGGDLTPGERLARRHPALPSSGSSQDRIYTQQNRDYPDDTDICFERGSQTNVVRVTPADLPKLFAAAGGLAPGLADLRLQAGQLEGVNWEYHPGELGRQAVNLVDRAYIAGQAAFSASNGQAAARDHLLGLAERLAGEPGGMAHRGAEALERVIAMLDPS